MYVYACAHVCITNVLCMYTNMYACANSFPDGSEVKNLVVVQETWVQSLGQEDPWRREWQPTPVFLPGESYGQRSLAGYSPRGRKELYVTE